MMPIDPLRERMREPAALTLRYEELRNVVAGKWDGRSSLPGFGTFIRAGMAAWIRNQLDSTCWKSVTPASRWDAKALPAALCGDVVGVLAGMALAAATTEV